MRVYLNAISIIAAAAACQVSIFIPVQAQAADARYCLNFTGGPMGTEFVNGCPDAITVVWCAEAKPAFTCENGYDQTSTLPPGGSTPISPGYVPFSYEWGACHGGADKIHNTIADNKSFRVNCGK